MESMLEYRVPSALKTVILSPNVSIQVSECYRIFFLKLFYFFLFIIYYLLFIIIFFKTNT
jgi:hypothetical protein